MPTFITSLNTEIATRGLNIRYNRTTVTLFAQRSPSIISQWILLWTSCTCDRFSQLTIRTVLRMHQPVPLFSSRSYAGEADSMVLLFVLRNANSYTRWVQSIGSMLSTVNLPRPGLLCAQSTTKHTTTRCLSRGFLPAEHNTTWCDQHTATSR